MKNYGTVAASSVAALAVASCSLEPGDLGQGGSSDRIVSKSSAASSSGYELWWDDVLVEKYPTWTRSQAAAHCEQIVASFPNKHVECFYDGQRLGYELFWNGKRVRYKPGWRKARAILNCHRACATNPNRNVTCQFGGGSVPTLSPWPNCGGVPTYVVRTESGQCEGIAGWEACLLVEGAPVGQQLCVYTSQSETVTDAKVAEVYAIATKYRTFYHDEHRYLEYRTVQAEPICSDYRPTCSSSYSAVRISSKNAVTCDPDESQVCCEAIGGSWSSESGCQPPRDGASGCDICGTGTINGRLLTAILDPDSDADPMAFVWANNNLYTVKLTPPPNTQVFTVRVDEELRDGKVLYVK